MTDINEGIPPQQNREYELYVQYCIMCDENKEFLKAITGLMNNLQSSDNDECKKILNDFMSSDLYEDYIQKHLTTFNE